MHDAGLLEALRLHHVFQRRARALDIGQQVVELQPLLRLGGIELEGEFGRRQRKQLQHAGIEQDVLRGEHGRRTHRTDHGEDLVALDHLLRRQHRLLRIVAVVLEDHLELAPVDAAGRVDLLHRHLHAVGNRNAPDLDRAGQVLMGPDHDLGGRDAFIGDLGLRRGRQMGQRKGADRKAQRLERFRHFKSPLPWPVLGEGPGPSILRRFQTLRRAHATARSPYMASISMA